MAVVFAVFLEPSAKHFSAFGTHTHIFISWGLIPNSQSVIDLQRNNRRVQTSVRLSYDALLRYVKFSCKLLVAFLKGCIKVDVRQWQSIRKFKSALSLSNVNAG